MAESNRFSELKDAEQRTLNIQTVNQKSMIASYWSNWAHVWDPMLRIAGLDKKYRKEAISMLRLEKGQTVLDAACGTGLNFPYLFDYVGSEGRIMAVDIAPGMLEKARLRAQKYGFDNITFIKGDISDIELPEVDAAAAFWCMTSIPEYRKALENIIGSLRPYGKVAILDFKRMDGFPGPIFNPIFGWIFRITNQDITREPWHDIERLLGDVQLREWKYGGIIGSAYLAWCTKT